MKRLETQRLSWNRSSSYSATGSLRLAGVLAAAVSASYVPTVSAQTDSNLVLEEIVVTVRRRVEMEQDVPISMKAMDADFIRKQNIVSFNDLGTKVPSVRISNAGVSTNEPIIAIRGQRPTDTALGLDQAAPVYLNEIVMTPSQGGNIGLFDLQNIQILKGPQGTLFGRNSTGGAILISTKRPGVDFGGYGQVEVGNYNLRAFEGAVDLPANDALQFRLATRIVKRDGYQDNVAPNALEGDNEFYDEDSQSFRVSMNLDLGELTSLTIADFSENDIAAYIPVLESYNSGAYLAASLTNNLHNLPGISYPSATQGAIDAALARQQARDPWEIETDVDATEYVQNVNVTNISELELTDDVSFKSVLGYRRVKFEIVQEADGTALPLSGAYTGTSASGTPFIPTVTFPDYYSRVTTGVEPTTTEAEQYSAEFQLVGDAFDGDLEWISGIYWYDMQGSISGDVQQVGSIPGYPAGTVFANPPFNAGGPGLENIANNGLRQTSPAGDVHNTALGLFGEGTYTFTDQFSLTAGLRYSLDDREVTVKNFSYSPNANVYACSVFSDTVPSLPLALLGQPCERTEDETFDSVTGRLSFNYTPVDGMLAYFSISTGYRAGGFNIRGNTTDTLQPFDEETVTTYELGHKTDWGLMGYAPIRTNVAVYYQEYDDIQKTQGFVDPSTTAFGTQTVNAAEAVIEGFEFDIEWAITENFRTNFAYAYTNTYYKDWDLTAIDTAVNGNLSAPATPTIDASGGDFTYIPTNTATLSLQYDLPVDLSLGEMTVVLNGYWQSEMQSHATGNLFNDEYAVLQNWSATEIQAAQDSVEIDSYNVWNFRFDWRNIMETNVDAALFVNNVTDEEYVVGGLNVVDLLGISAATYGPPRTFGASVRYNF